jgi:hypothetical protein
MIIAQQLTVCSRLQDYHRIGENEWRFLCVELSPQTAAMLADSASLPINVFTRRNGDGLPDEWGHREDLIETTHRHNFASRAQKACYGSQMPCSRIASIAALVAFSTLSGCTANRSAIGAGAFRTQFVLNDPHIGTPWPHHPYALMVDGYPLPFAREGKGIYRGVTDAQGRTARFRLDANIPRDKWRILERVGDGPLGQTFQMVSASGAPLADHAYQMVICSTPAVTHTGYTDAQGYVAYAASKEEAKLRVIAAHSYSGTVLIAACQDMKDEEIPQ